MTAGHFVFIPAVLIIGIVIGWILGSRAAGDAYAAELRRREERAARGARGSRDDSESSSAKARPRGGGAPHALRNAPQITDPATDESPAPPEVRR